MKVTAKYKEYPILKKKKQNNVRKFKLEGILTHLRIYINTCQNNTAWIHYKDEEMTPIKVLNMKREEKHPSGRPRSWWNRLGKKSHRVKNLKGGALEK